MNSKDIQKDPWCSSIQHSYTLWTAVKTVPRHHMGIQLLANWKSIQSVLTCSPIASRKPTSTLNIPNRLPNRPPGQKLGPQTEKMCFKRSTNLGILHHHQGKSMQHRKKGSKLLRAVWFSLPRKWYSVFGNLSPERGFPSAAAFSPNFAKDSQRFDWKLSSPTIRQETDGHTLPCRDFCSTAPD